MVYDTLLCRDVLLVVDNDSCSYYNDTTYYKLIIKIDLFLLHYQSNKAIEQSTTHNYIIIIITPANEMGNGILYFCHF